MNGNYYDDHDSAAAERMLSDIIRRCEGENLVDVFATLATAMSLAAINANVPKEKLLSFFVEGTDRAYLHETPPSMSKGGDA